MVLLATFGLTVFRDLTEGIVVGFALGSVIFIHRMSQSTAVEAHAGVLPPLVPEDQADSTDGERRPYHPEEATERDVVVYRITGAFFFGAASTVGAVLDRIDATYKALIVDLAGVPVLDSTAANTIAGLARKARRQGVKLYLSGASERARHELMLHGARPPLVNYKPTIDKALASFRRRQAEKAGYVSFFSAASFSSARWRAWARSRSGTWISPARRRSSMSSCGSSTPSA